MCRDLTDRNLRRLGKAGRAAQCQGRAKARGPLCGYPEATMKRFLPLLFVLALPSPAIEPKDWPNERLLGFAHELTDFVFQNHVVTDPARKTFGMTYEFWRDGKKIQEFGLDSMHDGSWLLSALVTMQRA